ncbi:hypothetical protein HF521_000081 [Silurus meridionalis]|uniref:Uncharacterized protein n=1 Tax=Silurus meridionalis TaxID=175797 RepID=A0A8T0BZF9_SILME|nr:hypothetical protein HF521_000081 [Silurus meridionalis]
MCTTIMVLTTVAVILRRRFSNRVKPCSISLFSPSEKPEGKRLFGGALSAEFLLDVTAARGRQQLKETLNIHVHSRSTRLINANQGYA